MWPNLIELRRAIKTGIRMTGSAIGHCKNRNRIPGLIQALNQTATPQNFIIRMWRNNTDPRPQWNYGLNIECRKLLQDRAGQPLLFRRPLSMNYPVSYDLMN